MASLLLIEDDPDQARLLGKLLRSAGHQVKIATDGAHGLAYARRRPPDLILLDLVMPAMDGQAVSAALTREPALAQVPVVLVSSLISDDSEERSIVDRTGAVIDLPNVVARVPKPVRPDELLAIVRQHALRE